MTMSDVASNFTCDYYDPIKCNSTTSCNNTENCTVMAGMRAHCYALWRNEAENITVTKKGCWLDDITCYNHSGCIEQFIEHDYHFCCCDHSMCNANFSNQRMATSFANFSNQRMATYPSRSTVAILVSDPPNSEAVILASVMLSFVVLCIVIAIFVGMKRWKCSYFRNESNCDKVIVDLASPDSSLSEENILSGSLQSLHLVEVTAYGKFGCIWRSQILDQFVAVKVFSALNQSSWEVERNIYTLLQTRRHDSILRFIGAEVQTVDLSHFEYWLVTEYHEKGSIQKYLKGNTLSWKQLVNAVTSLFSGLAYLHSQEFDSKPIIAHRDLKSANILLNEDLTVVISDFGLAVMLDAVDFCEMDAIQVGTWRYLAPEVLEGVIALQKESLLQIDVYASSLILWELVSRCSADDRTVQDYQLPFEDDVGLNPSAEDMINVVVRNRQRPVIKEDWLNHEGIAHLCIWMEECWDEDADARPSAHCLYNRTFSLLLDQQIDSNSCDKSDDDELVKECFL